MVTIYYATNLPASLGNQNSREKRTICEGIEALLDGRFAHFGDFLMQRLTALQAAHQEGSCVTARSFELIPPGDVVLPSEDERQLALRYRSWELRLSRGHAKGSGGRRHSPFWGLGRGGARRVAPPSGPPILTSARDVSPSKTKATRDDGHERRKGRPRHYLWGQRRKGKKNDSDNDRDRARRSGSKENRHSNKAVQAPKGARVRPLTPPRGGWKVTWGDQPALNIFHE